jgi:hypothetical protein
MMRWLFRVLVLPVLIAICFRNFGEFKRTTAAMPPGEYDELVQRELQYRGIRDRLVTMGYRSGRIALITLTFIRHDPKNIYDDKKHYQAQYNLIPLVVVPWTLDAPLVLGDFTYEVIPSEIPGLIPIYDSGNGLILFRRN